MGPAGTVVLCRTSRLPSFSSSILPSMGLPLQGAYFVLTGSSPALARLRVSTP